MKTNPGLSPKHREAKDELIIGLRTYISKTSNISKAAAKMKMSDNDLSKILRLERSVSMSKLEEMGNSLGLELVMRWNGHDEL